MESEWIKTWIQNGFKRIHAFTCGPNATHRRVEEGEETTGTDHCRALPTSDSFSCALARRDRRENANAGRSWHPERACSVRVLQDGGNDK